MASGKYPQRFITVGHTISGLFGSVSADSPVRTKVSKSLQEMNLCQAEGCESKAGEACAQ